MIFFILELVLEILDILQCLMILYSNGLSALSKSALSNLHWAVLMIPPQREFCEMFRCLSDICWHLQHQKIRFCSSSISSNSVGWNLLRNFVRRSHLFSRDSRWYVCHQKLVIDGHRWFWPSLIAYLPWREVTCQSATYLLTSQRRGKLAIGGTAWNYNWNQHSQPFFFIS